MNTPKLDDHSLEEILRQIRKDIGKAAWQSKSSVLFSLRAKYGDIIDKEVVSKIYDKIQKEENDG